ncbi:organic hydroperoxide resistance protein [Mastigocladopsis repens]|uniref:organic hydroperoxide resistance protein n=1 Tax=Mastigocladopsis repens TaxID=221287 RepID=UPI000315B299|nr:organic hydroperoxide resistance protein [Mastigocladopsis repens]
MVEKQPSVEQMVEQIAEPYTGSVMKPLYTATVSVTGGELGHARISGHARSSDGVLDLNLAMPKELGGSGELGTNPEQLFAAGYAACFHGSMVLCARSMRLNVSNSTVTCAVTIGRDPVDGGYRLSAQLSVEIPGSNREQAEQVVAKAHELCPYSKAIHGNVDVTVTVI